MGDGHGGGDGKCECCVAFVKWLSVSDVERKNSGVIFLGVYSIFKAITFIIL